MSPIARSSLAVAPGDLTPRPALAGHGNSPARGTGEKDELLLCAVLEALVTLEARFGADLGTAGLRKVRQAFEALGAVYCTRAVNRISSRRSPIDG
jgi:hypothetical protein